MFVKFKNSQTQKFSIRFLVFSAVLAFLFGSTACEQRKEEIINPEIDLRKQVCENLKSEGYLILRQLDGSIVRTIPEASQQLAAIEKQLLKQKNTEALAAFQNTYDTDGNIKSIVVEKIKKRLPTTLWNNTLAAQCNNYTAIAHI
jgi:hypothetical protein